MRFLGAHCFLGLRLCAVSSGVTWEVTSISPAWCFGECHLGLLLFWAHAWENGLGGHGGFPSCPQTGLGALTTPGTCYLTQHGTHQSGPSCFLLPVSLTHS